MASNPAAEIVSALQSASIIRHPDPAIDLNPSTAASKKERVAFASSPQFGSDIDDAGEDEIPISVLRPVPRQTNLPPLPDLRFEQSYLKSIEGARGWTDVAFITFRDQVGYVCSYQKQSVLTDRRKQMLLPLLQGVIWTLVVAGWRHTNRASQLSGASVGARIRRWWWGVNGWKLPEQKR